MKKIISLILLCFILLTSFSLLPALSADNGFDIENGVLTAYTGSASEVTVPSSVSVIGDRAFEDNADIVTVNLPSSVCSIGDRAFSGCTSLRQVKGGANVSEAGVYAFCDTPYFEDSTEEFLMLGKTLLWYNGDDPYITLPSDCLSIAPYAFLRCGTAKMIRSSSDIVSVGAGAFYECKKLTSVDLPASVTYIGAYAFEGTPFIGSLGEFPTLGDGILVAYNGSSAAVDVPDDVRRIGARAFRSSKLSSVSLPPSVYSVDPYAFADCTGLKSVDMSDGLVMIGDGAFSGCKSLEGLSTPSTLSYIGQFAFNSAAIEEARLLGNGLIISDNAFKSCTRLSCALLAKGVKAINDNAFSGCTGLEGISIPADASSVSSTALNGCKDAVVTCAQGSAADAALSSHEINHIIGDADLSGELNIIDVTAIQCNIAGLMVFDGAQTTASDYDFNGVIDILDASDVQLDLAYKE